MKTIAILSLLALGACADFSTENATMTKAQHEAFETGIYGYTPSKSVLAERAVEKGRPDLAAQYN